MTVTKKKNGSILLANVEGRVDTVTAPQFESEIKSDLNGVTELVLDFSQLTYISSAGLRVLVATDQAMEKRGGCMKIIHAGPYILEILDMTGLLNAFTVVSDK